MSITQIQRNVWLILVYPASTGPVIVVAPESCKVLLERLAVQQGYPSVRTHNIAVRLTISYNYLESAFQEENIHE